MKGNNGVVNLRSSALIRHCDFNLLGDRVETELIVCQEAKRGSYEIKAGKAINSLRSGKGKGVGIFAIKISTYSGSSKWQK